MSTTPKIPHTARSLGRLAAVIVDGDLAVNSQEEMTLYLARVAQEEKKKAARTGSKLVVHLD